MTDDYYFEEKPSPQTPEITPEWEEPDPGGHGGGAGWGPGSGWGPGGGGGGIWTYPPDEEEEERTGRCTQ